MTRYGTSHFVNFSSACAYYAPYGYTHEDVRQKVANGEISVVAPKPNAGERIYIIDDGSHYGRYGIEVL